MRPLWMAMLRPTISGVTVLARAQVLITVRSSAPKAATFFASLKSTNGPFFNERLILLPLCLVTASYDHLVGIFATACFVANCWLAPRCLWIAAWTCLAFTTAHWVVGGVHRLTMNRGAPAETATATSRAKFDVLMLFVADNTKCRHTFDTKTAHFTR